MAHNKTANIEGKTWGNLTAIKFSHLGSNGYRHWEFQCSCGKRIICSASLVWRGRTRSCGCMSFDLRSDSHRIHGYRNTRIYNIWAQLKQRCTNHNHIAYKRYGGRNIKVCTRWLRFENFLRDMKEPPSLLHSLDRINNSKGYSKANCRWATKKEQNRNSRNNIMFTLKGKTQCLSAWAEEYNQPYLLIWDRVRRCNWDLQEALLT